MRRFIELAYRGTAFHGWQRQPNACSVQQTLEEGLTRILRRPIEIVGAGRTDTGVHARRMFAHFDCEEPLKIADRRIAASLNTICGRDIAVLDIFPVADDMHARFSATERTYRYFAHFEPNPFLRDLSWHTPRNLDVDAMNRAAEILVDTEDFTSFAKLHTDVKTNICHVRKACWTAVTTFTGSEGLVFEISADRFLRNMVRAVVGTLVEVGRGKLTIRDFQEIIDARNRCAAGQSMPAHALYLWDVKY